MSGRPHGYRYNESKKRKNLRNNGFSWWKRQEAKWYRKQRKQARKKALKKAANIGIDIILFGLALLCIALMVIINNKFK